MMGSPFSLGKQRLTVGTHLLQMTGHISSCHFWIWRAEMLEICSSSLAPFCLHMWLWILRESLWQSDFDTVSFKSRLQEWKRESVSPWLLSESTLSFRLKKKKERKDDVTFPIVGIPCCRTCAALVMHLRPAWNKALQWHWQHRQSAGVSSKSGNQDRTKRLIFPQRIAFIFDKTPQNIPKSSFLSTLSCIFFKALCLLLQLIKVVEHKTKSLRGVLSTYFFVLFPHCVQTL